MKMLELIDNIGPQESEIESYKSGSYVQDMEEHDWGSEFKGLI